MARKKTSKQDNTKRAEQELLDVVQAERDKLAALVNSMSDEVWLADQDKKFTLMNPSALREFALGEGEVEIEKLATGLEVYRPDGSPRPVEEAPPLRALRGEVVRNEEELVRTPGSKEFRYRQVSAAPVRDAGGQIVGSVSVVRDITDHKRAEKALQASEQRLLLATQAAELGIYDHDLRSDKIAWDQRMREIWGIGPDEEITYDLLMAGLPPDDRASVQASVERALDPAGTHKYCVEHRVIHRRDGTQRWVAATGDVFFDQGRPVRLIGTAQDITERKQAQEERERLLHEVSVHAAQLREANESLAATNEELAATNEELRVSEQSLGESEQRYRSLFENMLDGYAYCRMLFDGQGRPTDFVYLSVNDAFTKLTGLHDVVGKRITEVIPTIREMHPEVLKTYGRVATTGRPERLEIELQPLGIWLSISVYCPQKGYFTAVFDNITARKRAEEALRQLSGRNEEALRVARMGHWEFDLATGIFTFNDQYYTLHGTTVQEAGGYEMSAQEFARTYVHPDDAHLVQEHIQRAAAATDPDFQIQAEARILRANGEARWVTVWFRIEKDARGKTIKLHGVNQDITERKKAEEALRQSRQRYAAIHDHASFPIVLFKFPEGVIIEVNAAFERTFGYSREEAIGKTTVQLGLASDPEAKDRMYAELVAKGFVRDWEMAYRTRSGRERLGSFSFERLNIDGQPYHLGIVIDITDRKRAEEALRASEERFRALTERGTDVVAIFDAEGKITYISPSIQALFGFAPEELVEQSLFAFIHPEDAERTQALIVEALRDPTGTFTTELRTRHKNGEWRWIAVVGRNLLADSAVGGMVANFQDITERKQAREALRESRERLERAQEIAHLGSWELDLVSNRLTWSDEAYRIFGLQPQEFGGTYEAFLDCVHPEDRAAVDAGYSGSLREGRDTYEIEHRIVQRFTGEIRIVHEKCEHVRDVSGRIIRSIGMVHDITERKRAEEALRELNATLESKVARRTAELQHRARQLQKLTLQLSQAEEQERRRIATILHEDLQQQIAGAKFHLSLVRNRAKEDGQRADIDAVDTMLKDAIEKSRTLARDLSPAVLHMNDLAEVLEWLANRMRAQQGLDVKLDLSGDMMLHSEALATFLFRATQELLFNVVKHAHVREASVRVRRIRRHVWLSVSDQGRGFDPQELKETSGLGLFSIRERTELLGGRMKVKSAKGQGSRCSLMVPDGPKPEDRGQTTEDGRQMGEDGLPSSILRHPSSGPVLRVLLVDDHDVVRAGLAAMLREAPGIELVGEAPDGREAINLANALQPDVVIMDVSMPLMSGDEATRQIKILLPQTRVIALSMYDEAEKKEKMFEAGAEGYILKTISADELLAAIRGRETQS